MNHLAGHLDILPTLVSLCKLDPPETRPLDGFDLSDLLLGKSDILPERLWFTKKSTESISPDGAARNDRYRFVIEKGDTMLFDMKADPGQKKDISAKKYEITQSLAMAYNSWFQDIISDYTSDTEIRIGYESEKSAYLPSHEAGFSGDIHFMEGHGWAHDWLVNWTKTKDSVYWNVVVDQTTTFKLELLYSCTEGNVGAILEASNSGNRTEAEITKSHDPEYNASPDRIKRIEVYEKEWARLSLGNLKLENGNQQIVMKAIDIPNGKVGEIKGLQLTKVIND